MSQRFLTPDWTEAEIEGLRTIVVPSGIGEFQWAFTKYINTGEPLAIFGLDGAPRRLHQFVELHPQVKAFGYIGFDYSQICAWQKEHSLFTWKKVKETNELGSLTMLACNPHLEAGLPLKDWLIDLPTTYRYDLHTTPEHFAHASRCFGNVEPTDVLIGISCASYRGAEAWKTWGSSEWTSFLHLVQKEIPNARFMLLGGAWDDLTYGVFDEDSGLRWVLNSRGLPTVGTTTFGCAVEVLKRLHGYIGFSSGLGHVAAHNCGTPVFMLWPDHQGPLSTSWVDPELLENGVYVPSMWKEPEEVFKLARTWLRRVADGDYKNVAVGGVHSTE